MLRGLIFLLLLPTLIKADDHWGTTPPAPVITLEHDHFSGIVRVSWISDSTFEKPIWYIVEVKQVDENRIPDPEFLWYRPIVPIQSSFNEYISISLDYRDNNGLVKDWSRAEIFRIRAMWGA
tara:strand:- start:1748 stop:2113 length:366 start_codon:yes stop_codon:yes gene_type:complete